MIVALVLANKPEKTFGTSMGFESMASAFAINITYIILLFTLSRGVASLLTSWRPG